MKKVIPAINMQSFVKRKNKYLNEIKYFIRKRTGLFHEKKIRNKKEILSLLKKQYKSRYPDVSLVILLKEFVTKKYINIFLESLMQQDYPGKIELIFIFESSQKEFIKIVDKYFNEFRNEKFTLIKSEVKESIDNNLLIKCGIELSKNDIVIFSNSNAILNRNMISAYVASYSYNDCEVVFGPYIQENDVTFNSLIKYEKNPLKIYDRIQFQDNINLRSFLNINFNNFSIIKDSLNIDIFEKSLIELCYNPDFMFDNIDLSFKFNKIGARIKFVPEAFVLNCGIDLNLISKGHEKQIINNFKNLISRNPDLHLVSRNWTYSKYNQIKDLLKNKENKTKNHIENNLRQFFPYSFVLKKSRKLNVLSYRWHCAHQYELYKLPYTFTLINDLPTYHTREWEYRHRPVPDNVVFKKLNQINMKDYDLAILHFDENVLDNDNSQSRVSSDWGAAFKTMVDILSIPFVAICHGTPQFYGQYNINYNKENLMQVIESEREKLVDFTASFKVICNSYQAQNEWGFKNSKVIWQGFNPEEFPPTLYKKGILSMGRSEIELRPHYRGYEIYEKVMNDFPGKYIPEQLKVPEPHDMYMSKSNEYAFARFRNYVDQIREYSIYFNPTLRSPMPRSRGEAMMCGLSTVNANNHDVDLFIKNGVDGFYSDEPGELKEHLLYLLNNPDKCKKIGMAGRITAMDVFNYDRYLKEWQETIFDLIGLK